MRISDWSSDGVLCRSRPCRRTGAGGTARHLGNGVRAPGRLSSRPARWHLDTPVAPVPDQRQYLRFRRADLPSSGIPQLSRRPHQLGEGGTLVLLDRASAPRGLEAGAMIIRSEEHTSELKSLMSISYALFCSK